MKNAYIPGQRVWSYSSKSTHTNVCTMYIHLKILNEENRKKCKRREKFE